MSDSVSQCPECHCDLQPTYSRQNVTVLGPRKPAQLLVRFPVLLCPVCRSLYRAEGTEAVIGEAIQTEISEQWRTVENAMEAVVLNERRRGWSVCSIWFSLAYLIGILSEISQRTQPRWLALTSWWSLAAFYVSCIVFFHLRMRKCQRQIDVMNPTRSS